MGFVTFATSESAKLALEASGDQLVLDGRWESGCGTGWGYGVEMGVRL